MTIKAQPTFCVKGAKMNTHCGLKIAHTMAGATGKKVKGFFVGSKVLDNMFCISIAIFGLPCSQHFKEAVHVNCTLDGTMYGRSSFCQIFTHEWVNVGLCRKAPSFISKGRNALYLNHKRHKWYTFTGFLSYVANQY